MRAKGDKAGKKRKPQVIGEESRRKRVRMNEKPGVMDKENQYKWERGEKGKIREERKTEDGKVKKRR